MILTIASSRGVAARSREVESPSTSQAAFHVASAQEIIDLRDAPAGTRDTLSEAPTFFGSSPSERSPPRVPAHCDAPGEAV